VPLLHPNPPLVSSAFSTDGVARSLFGGGGRVAGPRTDNGDKDLDDSSVTTLRTDDGDKDMDDSSVSVSFHLDGTCRKNDVAATGDGPLASLWNSKLPPLPCSCPLSLPLCAALP
jgi:hypothetical protein